MRKSKVLVSLAATALLSVGVGTIGQQDNVFTPQSVQAAKKTYKIKLKKNAKVFNKRGKRKGKKLLKKGHTYTTYGKKTIHGKKYYHLSKGRYIKAVNAKKVTKKAQKTSTKTFSVMVNKPAKIYDAQGKKTGFTLNKGAVKKVSSSKTIKGKKYYKIGDGQYILASAAVKVSPTSGSGTDSSGVTNTAGSSQNTDSHFNDPESALYPNASEVKQMLADKADDGYSIYFDANGLAEIKNYLWQDIQNYRQEKGLTAYKTNTELDNLVQKITQNRDIMWEYELDLAGATKDTLAPYLPTLTENGMNMTDTWIEDSYYGRRVVGREQPKEFDFFDCRNPEHVATQIFESCKSNSYYNKMILGHNDKQAFASLGLCYNWHGTAPETSIGVAFIEVSGKGEKWTSFYNAN